MTTSFISLQTFSIPEHKQLYPITNCPNTESCDAYCVSGSYFNHFPVDGFRVIPSVFWPLQTVLSWNPLNSSWCIC